MFFFFSLELTSQLVLKIQYVTNKQKKYHNGQGLEREPRYMDSVQEIQ